MFIKGYNYRIDSSLLVFKDSNDSIRQVCIFAKSQKDLKQYINVLKERGDTGSMKVQERLVHKHYIPENSSYEELCKEQLKNMEMLLKRNE